MTKFIVIDANGQNKQINADAVRIEHGCLMFWNEYQNGHPLPVAIFNSAMWREVEVAS